LAAAASGCPLIDVAELKVGGAFEGASPHRETIALVQYTSGSVSNPKGVVINHGNLLANLSMIREAFQGDETKALVSWLPPHHDMGLIGCVLAPLFSGMTAALMSPFAFLQRPLRWLQAMQKFGATTAGAPNFAYDLCARQISDTEARKLDLSAWRLAFCGSEPLRPGTFRRFAERFAAAGFDPRAFLACYGMAEATLLVTSARVGAGISAVALDPNSEQKVISCGTPCRGTYVLIEPSAAVGGPPETGEICVSGEHVTAGFWDGASAAMRTDPERELVIDGRRYLRTGDAGLIRDGELYVVGRLSDMIIVNGANIHAEDIEATVLEMSEEEDLSAVAAFGVQAEQREELIVACELKRRATPADPLAILEMLGRAVADAHGVLPTEVLLLDYGALERTGTGKIRRGATRAQYLAGSLNGISWRAPGPRSLEALG
jgi:acyl-CoA synthetase (AMP-forming)/AMP-acid ligase II